MEQRSPEQEQGLSDILAKGCILGVLNGMTLFWRVMLWGCLGAILLFVILVIATGCSVVFDIGPE